MSNQRSIRIGLGAIKNVSDDNAQLIVSTRKAGGGFKSFEDFASRLDFRKLGRKTLESLILAGALDDFGDRSALMASLDTMIAYSTQIHNLRSAGQMTIFESLFPPLTLKAEK